MQTFQRNSSLLVAITSLTMLAAPLSAQEEEAMEETTEIEAEADAPIAAPGDTGDASAPVDAVAPSEMGAKSLKVPDIVKKIKSLQQMIKQSQQRMDEVVSIVLNTSETKGAKAIIALANSMSGSFVPVQAVVTLDGAPIFKKSDDDGILESGEMEVFNGAILPGEHTLSVLLVYRGAGYGIFSYLQGYKFKVRSSTKFKVKEGKGIDLKIIGYEKGDQDTKMEDRPAIKYVQTKIEID